MFESEDFDLDEDFLKDIGEKEEQYYSQKVAEEKSTEPPTKKPKRDNLDSDFLDDITFDDEPDFAKSSTVPKKVASTASLESEDVSNRKKRILEIFSSSETSDSKTLSLPTKRKSPQLPTEQKSLRVPNNSLEAYRKTAALQILKKAVENEVPNNQNPISSVPNLKKPSLDYKNNRISNPNKETTFKKPSDESSSLRFQRTSPKFPQRDRNVAAPRVTLVRKFPGPAGLLPDNPDANIDQANFLDASATEESIQESKMSEYCSQNTERLFSGGAWRRMLDDLPPDFLRSHEIVNIKKARDSRISTRVQFVAGVVQMIDQSVENPRLVLKDMTDTLEATMHSDIPLKYPNVFEPGVVILLRDAGLLGFQGSQKCPGPQFHLMIGLKNLLAVYSEKARLVSSPWFDSMLKTTTNCSYEQEKRSTEDKYRILKEPNEEIEDFKMDIGDFGSDEEDLALCSNLEEIKEMQSFVSFSKGVQRISGKFSVGKSASKGPQASQQPGKKSPDITKQTNNIERTEELTKVEIRPKAITGIRSKLLQFRSNDDTGPEISQDSSNKKSPLLAENAANLKEKNSENEDCLPGTFGDDLLASDNDTEDEILSQLDVDSIMTNYNASS